MVDDQPAKEHPVARGHTIKIERDAIVFNPLAFYDGVIRADIGRGYQITFALLLHVGATQAVI